MHLVREVNTLFAQKRIYYVWVKGLSPCCNVLLVLLHVEALALTDVILDAIVFGLDTNDADLIKPD